METTPKKNGDELAEEREKLNTEPTKEVRGPESQEPVSKQTKKHKMEGPVVSRAHDFAHVHPSHARHKTFGLDHEPGAI